VLGAQSLSTGQLEVATRASASARTLAQRHGLVLDEAEIVILGAWLRALAGAEDLWDQALLEFAEHFRSPRHAAHHRFVCALRDVDLGTLEALTAVQDVAPMVARGARTALQRPSLNSQQLGAIGTALLTRMPRRWDVVIDAGPGWGLDHVRGEIWRRGSPPVNVRRSTRLRAILDTLARHGGRASKEVLHQEAWEAQDYHPLRDDKRIQVAIRDLRRRVEPDPSAPVLLLTTEDGYALSPDASFTILRAPATP
jgi:DNA-binding response OmpR family regulator